MNLKPIEYDGIHFLPDYSVVKEDGEEFEVENIRLIYFNIDEQQNMNPIEESSIGHKWHITFFDVDEETNSLKISDNFEAILIDPTVYIKNFAGMGMYGLILRKTNESKQWLNDYLTRLEESLKIKKLKHYAESIAE
jgi:hypothetical protein